MSKVIPGLLQKTLRLNYDRKWLAHRMNTSIRSWSWNNTLPSCPNFCVGLWPKPSKNLDITLSGIRIHDCRSKISQKPRRSAINDQVSYVIHRQYSSYAYNMIAGKFTPYGQTTPKWPQALLRCFPTELLVYKDDFSTVTTAISRSFFQITLWIHLTIDRSKSAIMSTSVDAEHCG